MCFAERSGFGLNALLGRILKPLGAQRKPNGYAETNDCCCAKEQQHKSWCAEGRKAANKEGSGQEEESCSCPAMQRDGISDPSIVHDIEWL